MKHCTKEDCTKKHYAKNFCRSHYDMLWRRGTTDRAIIQKKQCEFPNCETRGTLSGYCKLHHYELIKKPYQKEYVKKWNKEKAQKDINFRLTRNIRNRLYSAIKKNKAGSAIKDLGCSIDELKKHLESRFQPGMTWDNYGKWHIDHIKPLSKFDLTNSKQFKEACHYSNLQPLWRSDNIRKYNNTISQQDLLSSQRGS